MRSSFVLLFIFHGFFVFAQTDTSVFQKSKSISVAEYVLNIPADWKPAEHSDISVKDLKYEFTGVGLPKDVNGNPLTAFFTLRRYECRNIAAAEDYIITEFSSYPDRVTPNGFNYERDSVKISSGEKATLFFTHFYRGRKLYNYSRYDLVAYSKKRKVAYMLTVTYMYKDPTYAVENSLKMKEYAIRVFSGLLLR